MRQDSLLGILALQLAAARRPREQAQSDSSKYGDARVVELVDTKDLKSTRASLLLFVLIPHNFI
jgi:hypothetical protein